MSDFAKKQKRDSDKFFELEDGLNDACRKAGIAETLIESAVQSGFATVSADKVDQLLSGIRAARESARANKEFYYAE